MRVEPGEFDLEGWRQLITRAPRLDEADSTVLLVEISTLKVDWPVLSSYLCAEEQRKANRFFRETDRARFVGGRALLRLILGEHYSCEPAAVIFREGPFGKPELEWPKADGLRFNISHSGDVVLLGVSRVSEIGVDIEQLNDFLDVSSIAAECLSPIEQDTIQNLPTAKRVPQVLQLWNMREALLKASGLGLSALQRLGTETRIVPTGDREFTAVIDSARWRLATLPTFKNYVSAIAVRPENSSFHHWEWRLG